MSLIVWVVFFQEDVGLLETLSSSELFSAYPEGRAVTFDMSTGAILQPTAGGMPPNRYAPLSPSNLPTDPTTANALLTVFDKFGTVHDFPDRFTGVLGDFVVNLVSATATGTDSELDPESTFLVSLMVILPTAAYVSRCFCACTLRRSGSCFNCAAPCRRQSPSYTALAVGTAALLLLSALASVLLVRTLWGRVDNVLRKQTTAVVVEQAVREKLVSVPQARDVSEALLKRKRRRDASLFVAFLASIAVTFSMYSLWTGQMCRWSSRALCTCTLSLTARTWPGTDELNVKKAVLELSSQLNRRAVELLNNGIDSSADTVHLLDSFSQYGGLPVHDLVYDYSAGTAADLQTRDKVERYLVNAVLAHSFGGPSQLMEKLFVATSDGTMVERSTALSPVPPFTCFVRRAGTLLGARTTNATAARVTILAIDSTVRLRRPRSGCCG